VEGREGWKMRTRRKNAAALPPPLRSKCAQAHPKDKDTNTATAVAGPAQEEEEEEGGKEEGSNAKEPPPHTTTTDSPPKAEWK